MATFCSKDIQIQYKQVTLLQGECNQFTSEYETNLTANRVLHTQFSQWRAFKEQSSRTDLVRKRFPPMTRFHVHGAPTDNKNTCKLIAEHTARSFDLDEAIFFNAKLSKWNQTKGLDTTIHALTKSSINRSENCSGNMPPAN